MTSASASASASAPGSSLPDPALPAPSLQDDEEGFTAEQLITRQQQLEDAAREAVPFSFLKGGCTYEKGYIRQPVYACRTCGGGGVCSGCSVGCHAEHDLVELFAKRAFRCDCGALSLCRGDAAKETSLPPCNLRSKDLKFVPQNDNNKYDKNFEGHFCRCSRGKQYNAETEEETMFQCLSCEDWVHESCTSLRPSLTVHDIDAPDRQLADGPLVDHDSFELFICHECVTKPEHNVLQHYLGSKGWIVCLPTGDGRYLPECIDGIPGLTVYARGDSWSHPWRVYGLVVEPNFTGPGTQSAALPSNAMKREAIDDVDTPTDSKRVRIQSALLDVPDSFSEREGEEEIWSRAWSDGRECIENEIPLFANPKAKPARLDVFLTDKFRERLCRCKECFPIVSELPWLLRAEDTYSPPRSQTGSDGARSEGGASQTSSTYDLGLAALQRLPRAQMMESLDAYNRMRDALFSHLRPFADAGKPVDAESLREFFRKQREKDEALSSTN